MQGKENNCSGLSLSERIALQLREDIIDGRLLGGTSLVETELGERYGASRNTIRGSLHQLSREGLATYVRNRGVMVRCLGSSDVRDIYLVRRIIETQAIRNSKPLREYQSDRMLEAIASAEQARENENWQAVSTHSLRFHQYVIGLLSSPRLDEFFAILAAQLRLAFAAAPNEKDFQCPWIERDRHIHDLLEGGQRKAAAEAMLNYLNDSEQVLLDLFSE